MILALVIFNSCHMHKLTVDVYSPPAIELPPDVRGIVVTSRYVPASGDYEAVQHGYFDSVDSVKWDLSRYYTQVFANTLDSTDRYISKTDFNLRMLRNNNDTLPEPLPWVGLTKIVEQKRAPGLAILQGFDILEDDVSIEASPETEAAYKAIKKIEVIAAWRILQPERRRLIDENIYSFSREFFGIGASPEEAAANLPGDIEMKKQACKYAAEQYASLIIPGADNVERDYYRDGDPKLIEAHEAILEGNWGTAESKWTFLAYRSEDDEVKAKASYNMALFCEKDGRLNQALGFARKANKLMPNRRHLNKINNLLIKLYNEEDLRDRGEIIRNW